MNADFNARVLGISLAVLIPVSARAGIVWSESFDATDPVDLKIEFNAGSAGAYSPENYSSMTVAGTSHAIPEAPNQIAGSLPTRGILLRVVYDDAGDPPIATAATERIVNLVAKQTSTGSRLALVDNYRLSFDFYLRLSPLVTFNATTGLPVEAGTTEQMLWGVGYNATAGFPLARGWRSGRGNGMWGWLSTEGGHGTTVGADAALYKAGVLSAGRNLGYTAWDPTPAPVADTTTYFTPAFGAASTPMASAPANQWVHAEMTVLLGKVSVSYQGANGAKTEFFSAVDGSGSVDGSVMVGYEDSFTSASFSPGDQWMLLDNMVVEDITPPTMDVNADVPFTTFTGTPQNGSFIISNSQSAGSLTVSAVSFAGANAADFSLVTSLPLVIPAGQSAALAVQFNPSGADGVKTATLNITSDDPQRPAYPPITLQARKSIGSFLMAHYKLDESSGANAANPFGPAGAFVFENRQPMEFGRPPLTGGAGSSIRFLPAQTQTSGNYMTTNVVHTPSFSVSMWVLPESTGATRTLFQRDSDFAAPTDGIYGLLLDVDGSLVWRVNGQEVLRSEQNLIPDALGTPDDKPAHVVVTHSDLDGFGNSTADITRLFVNGVLVNEKLSPDAIGFGDYPLNPAVASGMHIASRTTAGNGFQGLIDDIQIYGAAITPEQAAALYAQPGRHVNNLLTRPLGVTGFTYNPQASSISLSWSSEAGAVYAIEESVNLTQWTEVSGQTGIASGGATTSTTITGVSAADKKFYRAKRTTPQ